MSHTSGSVSRCTRDDDDGGIAATSTSSVSLGRHRQCRLGVRLLLLLLLVLPPEHGVEADDDHHRADDSAEVDLLGEDEGAHDGHDDHHERAERRREHRSGLLDHQALHVVGDCRRHDALNKRRVIRTSRQVELSNAEGGEDSSPRVCVLTTYGIGGGEEVHVEADGPDGDAALHGEDDHHGLQRAEEADERGERQLRRVLLDGVRLQDEEEGPCEGSDDDEQRAQEPVAAADVVGRRGGGLGAAAGGGVLGPCQLHERALVQRHQHRAGHRHQRPRDLGLAPHLLHLHLLHPTRTPSLARLDSFQPAYSIYARG
jgi:hypothetical protein